MLQVLQNIWEWFSPQAYQVGVMVVLAWWLAGVGLGFVFNLLKRS